MQNVRINALVRHTDGRVEPFSLGLLDSLDHDDRVEISIDNNASDTLCMHLIAIDDAGEVGGIGSTFLVTRGSFEIISIRAGELPTDLDTLAFMEADNADVVDRALSEGLRKQQLRGTGVDLVTIRFQRRSKKALPGSH